MNNMVSIENITYVTISGQRQYTIEVSDGESNLVIGLPLGKLDRSIVINTIIRCKYSQDAVEAIINNHFINISEWIDLKFKGEEVEFSDPDYEALQQWRAVSKELATLILENIERIESK